MIVKSKISATEAVTAYNKYQEIIQAATKVYDDSIPSINEAYNSYQKSHDANIAIHKKYITIHEAYMKAFEEYMNIANSPIMNDNVRRIIYAVDQAFEDIYIHFKYS